MERERGGGEMERVWGWGERESKVGEEMERVFHFFWGLNLVTHSVHS